MLELTPQELKELSDSKKTIAILDVREHEELLISVLPKSLSTSFLHLPLMQIPENLDKWLSISAQTDYRVVVCRIGGRSAQAVQYLNNLTGVEHYNLVGGINLYAKEIDPTIQIY